MDDYSLITDAIKDNKEVNKYFAETITQKLDKEVGMIRVIAKDSKNNKVHIWFSTRKKAAEVLNAAKKVQEDTKEAQTITDEQDVVYKLDLSKGYWFDCYELR